MYINLEGLLNSLRASWSGIFPIIVNLLAALLLLLIGLLIARGLGFLATLLLRILKLDSLSEQTGFDSILQKGDIKKKTSELVGDLLYWIVAFVVIIGVAGLFGLPVERALSYVFAYMGIVFLASLILGVGMFLAGLIAGIVRIVMANFGLEGAKTASRVVYYIVIIFAFLAALSELGLQPQSFAPHLGVIIGAPALAAAIAFGLGCKDMAADFLHNLFKGK
jgi:hypothetical protein